MQYLAFKKDFFVHAQEPPIPKRKFSIIMRIILFVKPAVHAILIT